MARNMVGRDRKAFTDHLRRSRPDEVGAKLAREIIQARTEAGRDRRARRFRRYKPRTVKAKIRKGQQVSPVNLRDSGKMMGGLRVRKRASTPRSMKTVVEPNTARDKRIMEYHVHGTPHMDQRDPMGLTSVERAKVERKMGAKIRRHRLSQRIETVRFAIHLRA